MHQDVIVDLLAACGPRPVRQHEPEAVHVAVEVTSPATGLRDRGSEEELHEAHGIPRYLLVDLDSATVTNGELEAGVHRLQRRTTGDVPGQLPARSG